MSEPQRPERDPRNSGGDAEGAGKRFPSSLMWIFVALGFLIMANWFFMQVPREALSYSDLRTKVQNTGAPGSLEKVSKAVVSSRKILVTVEVSKNAGDAEPKEKHYLVELAPTFEPKDFVNLMAEKGVVVEFTKDDELFAQLLLWTFPLLLVIVFWLWLMRRMGPPQSVMSFGKSKAKIYAEKEVKVSFDDVA
ncbi:MAG: hypothetical protein ACYTG4_06760, partial [Planctomycetota bacterium]